MKVEFSKNQYKSIDVILDGVKTFEIIKSPRNRVGPWILYTASGGVGKKEIVRDTLPNLKKRFKPSK